MKKKKIGVCTHVELAAETASRSRFHAGEFIRMRRAVDHGAMAVAGYTVPWHAPRGRTVGLHLSSSKEISNVRVVRLDTPQPAHIGWRVQPATEPPAHRSFEHGSFLRVSASELAKPDEIDGVSFEVYLTRNAGDRTIVETDTFRLSLQRGGLVLQYDGRRLLANEAIPARAWLRIEIRAAGNGLSLKIESHDLLAPLHLHRRFEVSWRRPSQDLLFGASASVDTPTLNAKFSSIALLGGSDGIAWTFPALLPAAPIASKGKATLFLEAVNQPTFCMTSPRWNGTSFDPRLVPSHYDAVHCHDDDMGPLEWPVSYAVDLPAEAEAGIYAFDVEYDGGSERIVFFVVSSTPRAPLLFLVPTATYLAYADEYLPAHLYEWKCEDRGHRFAIDNNLRSLYDYHSDVSGVSISSYRKPKATLRDDYNYPLCGCPHNLPVDLHFLRFCHRNGIAFDLITDHCLHERGLAGLQGYAAVVTGSHPEYMSVEMEDALRRFAASGGSIAYLGGNGFAGKVAFTDDLMELRRSPLEAGRTWDGQIAEQSLSITNEPGGHLRASGRGEFSLTGGAISLMGFDGARPFTRTSQSYGSSASWLFEGVVGETFGDEGIVLGAAAGYEVDATDKHLGTSPDTIIIARAAGFPDSFAHDATRWYERGESERKERRCAEMTLRHLAAGGLIFSASSVAWCGALPASGTNDVGRITVNLLGRLASAKDRPVSRENTEPET